MARVEFVALREGDALATIFHAQTTDRLALFAANGRVYTLGGDKLPGGRGFGEPVRLSIDLDAEVKKGARRVERERKENDRDLPKGGTLLSGAEAYRYALRPRTDFLVEIDEIPDDVLRRAGILVMTSFVQNGRTDVRRNEILATNVLLSSGYEFTFGSAQAHFPEGKAGRIVGRASIEGDVAAATAKAGPLAASVRPEIPSGRPIRTGRPRTRAANSASPVN